MDYLEACESTVTREDARKEIKLHGGSFEDFLVDVGDETEYQGQEVLDWLGY